MAESTSVPALRDGEKLAVGDAKEIAEFYGVPLPLMNMMFVVIGGIAYPKETFLLYQGHRKGILRIEVDEPKEVATEGVEKEWQTEARIYPKVDSKILDTLLQYPPDERKKIWEHLTQPTVEWGRASKKNVRMSTMLEWLPQIAIKRAVCRALRLYSGIGSTAFEELPQVEIPENDLKSVKNVTKRKKEDEQLDQKLPI